jgi:hypothetical protein
MFFSHNITTLFVTVGEIRSAVFSSRGKLILEEKIYDWTEKSLPTVLGDIAARGPQKIRVVFGEEFSYVLALKFSDKSREKMFPEAQDNIPDVLSNNWDFQKENDPDFPSQVAAIQQHLFDFFISKLKEANFQIEAIEPQSVALARLLPKSGVFLFAVKYEKVLFGAVRNGVVTATFVASDDDAIVAFENFLSYVKKKCKEVPKKVFVSSNINKKTDVFSRNNLSAEIYNLDPLMGIALKKDIKGEDWKVLNIDWKNK